MLECRVMNPNVIQVPDIPVECLSSRSVAIDTETTGLNIMRDRLCLTQLCFGNDDCYIIKMSHDREYPNLKKLLSDDSVEKIFHFARFDVAVLDKFFGIRIGNIFCTKIASRIVRTYTGRHGLKDLCKELLSIELPKEEQTSYWGGDEFRESQLVYAAKDVLYLHKLREILKDRLVKEHKTDLAEKSFKTLLGIVELDLNSYDFMEIFNH